MRRRAARILLAGLLLLVGPITFGGCGGNAADEAAATTDPPAATAATSVKGVAETRALLEGVRQYGLAIGEEDAPVTLLEYVDLQCPFCAKHQLDVQPTLIKELVRTGEAQIAIVPLAFLGPDSTPARAVLLELAERDHAWDFLNLFYWNQGQENSGYVTQPFLESLVAEIPGTTSADAAPKLTEAQQTLARQADTLGQAVLGSHKAGTPGFAVGATGGNPAAYDWIPIYQEEPAADQLIDAVRKAAKNPAGEPARPTA